MTILESQLDLPQHLQLAITMISSKKQKRILFSMDLSSTKMKLKKVYKASINRNFKYGNIIMSKICSKFTQKTPESSVSIVYFKQEHAKWVLIEEIKILTTFQKN